MQSEHPIDRAARRIRGPITILAGLCLPVCLLSYGWMVKTALETWPLWASIPAVLSHIIAALGLASLLDIQQERRNRQ
jgi:hypothetical protein